MLPLCVAAAMAASHAGAAESSPAGGTGAAAGGAAKDSGSDERTSVLWNRYRETLVFSIYLMDTKASTMELCCII